MAEEKFINSHLVGIAIKDSLTCHKSVIGILPAAKDNCCRRNTCETDKIKFNEETEHKKIAAEKTF